MLLYRFMSPVMVIGTVLFLCFLPEIPKAQPPAQKTEIMGHTMYTVLKPGDIPAIFEPQFISPEEAEQVYYSDEPLIAVVDGDSAKAYSTWHLDRHEVVNDYINGRAITVTW